MNRYNPHSLQKDLSKLSILPLPHPMSLNEEVFFLAEKYWKQPTKPSYYSPFMKPEDISKDRFLEYGIDACRLAKLSSSKGGIPTDSLLESSYKWLSSFYEKFFDLDCKIDSWSPGPWLIAAQAARDHLLARKRPYASFSMIKKANKEAKLTLRASIEGKLLCSILLMPFAPVMGITLVDLIYNVSTFPESFFSFDSMASAFPPLKPYCISTKDGGRKWEVLNSKNIKKNLKTEISKLPWVKKTFKNIDWTLSKTPDGWMICPSKKILITKDS